jgi:hypothetical protein
MESKSNDAATGGEEVESVKGVPDAEANSAEAQYPTAGDDQEEGEDEGEVGRDGNVVETQTTEYYDKDEEIITAMLAKGTTRATSQELLDAGIDSDRIHPYSFRIGRYSLHRLILVGKYTIEKVV